MTPEELKTYCDADPGYVRELDGYGYTPLITMCISQDAAMAAVLVQAGADVNFVAPDGESPLKAAIPDSGTTFNRALFDLLINAGANPNTGCEPALHIAVGRGHRDLVRYLIERGADPNFNDCDDTPPLFWTGAYGGKPDVPMMKLLVELGADFMRPDGVGQTMAKRIGPKAIFEILLQMGEEAD